ncbi:MAG: 2-amino-4-hydroxy-6-hydroxymethyldihydropteridine diphosphokinase [Anaerolineales bacterium]|nr:MAG: 2-amino-4-hydroxy-6-hydroxymethyldihydropteridine diphosphokinase [Anaerolineales bacterium]
MTEFLAYIGLGSNIKPEANLKQAAQALAAAGQPGNTRLTAVSSVWKSPPLGSEGPQFLNAAAELHTQLGADELRSHLRSLEAAQGRLRSEDRNAPRTLDLDLLLYDGQEMDRDIWDAAHIAAPLSELLPAYKSTVTGETLTDAASRLLENQRAKRTRQQLTE